MAQPKFIWYQVLIIINYFINKGWVISSPLSAGLMLSSKLAEMKGKSLDH